ncbi:hypothetical protein [Thiococcus pfennigii]|uniref:hypothetical protein n=1 Tax=Thiococcus pfennigii TaxID=1057 RepID=UPI00190796DB|nr:hypothetical protein [Thiococcus pfennigii]MBK1733642.1 hypothetical protein [Thiococcus pfennigii]
MSSQCNPYQAADSHSARWGAPPEPSAAEQAFEDWADAVLCDCTPAQIFDALRACKTGAFGLPKTGEVRWTVESAACQLSQALDKALALIAAHRPEALR